MLTPLTLTSIILACAAFFLAAFVNGRLMKRLYDVTRRYKKSVESEVYLINAKTDLQNKLNRALAKSAESLKTTLRNADPDFFFCEEYSVRMLNGYKRCFIVYEHYTGGLCDIVIKRFATDDEAYNKMAAEELLEKLNEKL